MSLDEYLEKILEKYDEFDEGHDRTHIHNLMTFATKLWESYFKDEIDFRLIKTAIYFHDLGLEFDRKSHHVIGQYLVRNSEELRSYFSDKEIEDIAKAVLEHRASYDEPVTHLLSKIVADADHSEVGIERMIRRSISYNISKGLNDYDEIFNAVYSHLKEKYGEAGYCRLLLKESEDILRERKIETEKVLNTQSEFIKFFDMIYNNM